MKNRDFSGADYLLLLLYLNDKQPIKGSIRLVKMMFLFDKEIKNELEKLGVHFDAEKMPEFIAYKFGPFSKDLYEILELFESIGFVKKRNIYKQSNSMEEINFEEPPFIDETYQDEDYNQENKFIEYIITQKGSDFVVERLIGCLTKGQIDLLERFKAKIVSISVKDLLFYVYSKYTDYTEESEIKDQVFSRD